MKFVQRRLGETANASSGRKLTGREYLRIVLFVVLGLVFINLFVWATVEVGVRFISVEREAVLFSFLGGEDDGAPELELYRDTLEKLRTYPSVLPYPYRLFLVEDDRPNAFAVMGGAIGITQGLVETLGDDEIAVAFLLGHELGHFAHRDHLRGAGRALLLAGCYSLFFPQGGGDCVSGMTYEAIITAYSRRQEEQADLFGLRLVYDVYGHTDGATRLLERLHEDRKIPDWAYMFTTHPGPERRIRLLENALEQMEAEATS